MLRYVAFTLVTAALAVSVLGGLYAIGALGASPENATWQWPKDNLPTTEYVRDYTLHYLRDVKNMKSLPDPLATTSWTSEDITPKGILGYTTLVYKNSGTVITIGYPIVAPDNMIYNITVESNGKTVWQGQLFQGQFTTPAASATR